MPTEREAEERNARADPEAGTRLYRKEDWVS
jgi:hypothetical protein